MEILPSLRRIPRRLALILYLLCTVCIVCALYSFYRDREVPANRPPPVITNAKLLLNSEVLQTKDSDTKYVYLSPKESTSTPPPPTTTVQSESTLPPDTCRTSKYKLILLWTPFFGVWEYFPKGPFAQCSCPNCRVTTDRRRLNESDAVIFHARDMTMTDVPPFRLPHQRWVFYCLESPPYSDFPGMQFMAGMFNWTMTYRGDSDVVIQYGKAYKVLPPRKLNMTVLSGVWRNKTKSVVWLSSHCPTAGGRDDYVEELRKYIDVDVYGRCGTLDCPKGATERCHRDFAARYRFFLAFENSICRDYITEKFYRALNYDMVPVVFGKGYGAQAPPGSYIDALEFKSPRHLAFFLTGVGRDFPMYSRYFKWRRNYGVDTDVHKECALCAMLHRNDVKASSYRDLREWWIKDAQCTTWEPKR